MADYDYIRDGDAIYADLVQLAIGIGREFPNDAPVHIARAEKAADE